ncbi:MAG: hypothetical protein ACRDBO_00210 [Lachnospiraceae bacterium]
MVIFQTEYALRHFGEIKNVRGREKYSYDEQHILADIQTLTRNNSMDVEGANLGQRIQMWSDMEITPTDEAKEQLGDWIFYEERWFQCISSVWSGNTFLGHWVSEFDLVPLTDPKAEIPPSVSPDKKG